MRSSVAAPTRSPGSARGITTLVPAQLAIQGGGIDAEHLGGAGLVAAFALEHPGDIGALDHVERGVRMEPLRDRKSTRLNSSHGSISYAVFCLKKKKRIKDTDQQHGMPGT